MIGNYENSLEVVETPRLQAEERTALTSLADRQIERVLQAFNPTCRGQSRSCSSRTQRTSARWRLCFL